MTLTAEEDSMLLKRKSDIHQAKIDELIEEEQDHKTRLTLMIMSNLNKSVIANTDLIVATQAEILSIKQEWQLQQEQQDLIKNQGIGMYKVLRILTPVLWVVASGTIALMYNSYVDFQKEMTSNMTSLSAEVQRIETAVTLHGVFETLPKNKLK